MIYRTYLSWVFFYKLFSLVIFLNGGENTTKVWRSFIFLGLIWADQFFFFGGLVGWEAWYRFSFFRIILILGLALYLVFNRS